MSTASKGIVEQIGIGPTPKFGDGYFGIITIEGEFLISI
jgi:hypothetical protein